MSIKMGKRVGEKGFTIVELLIVVVVIAILAAITIVAYNGISNRAKQASVQSASQQAYKKVLAYGATNAEQFPATLADAGVSDANGTSYQYVVNNTSNPKTFCITATSNSMSYYVDNGTNTNPKSGACPGHGEGGVIPIANLMPNPNLAAGSTGWAFVTLIAGATVADSIVPTGGPLASVPNFWRRTNSTAYTSSPASASIVSPGLNAIPVTAGATYNVSAYVRTSCATITAIRIDLSTYDSAGTPGTALTGTAFASAASASWFRLSRTATVPAGVSYIRPQLAFSGPATCAIGTTMDGSAVMVTEGSTLYPYADGNSLGWAWTGAQNGSSSVGPPL